MPMIGPDPSIRTARACEKCNHFGGWPGAEEMGAWCLKNQFVFALSYGGCCDWTPQPEGWLYPPEVSPIEQPPPRRHGGARIL